MEPMQITITGTKVTITGDRVIGFQFNALLASLRTSGVLQDNT